MTIRRAIIIATVLLFLGPGVGSVRAQDETETGSPFAGKDVASLVSEVERQVTLARRLIREKNYQGAADVLEVALESHPDNTVVQQLLKNSYDRLKQYSKVEMLVRRMLQANPGSVSYRLDLAEVLVKLGRAEEASQSYRQLADDLDPADEKRQLLLVRSLMSSHLEDLALEQIAAVRLATGVPTALAIEKGNIHESAREYVDAAREYLAVLDIPGHAESNEAEKRLMALLEFPESSGRVETTLVSIADSTSEVPTLRILTDHYVKAGELDKAFEYALKQDSLGHRDGSALVLYMRQCFDRKSWSGVINAARYILARYANTKIELETRFEYAYALARLGHYAEAIATYERVFESTPNTQLRADALCGIGTIYGDLMGDYEKALTYYDSVVTYYPKGLSYLESERAIPLCYLRNGDLKKARETLVQLRRNKLPDDYQEEAAYYLGLVDFFEKKYDSAEVSFRKLLVNYPRGFYINDALRMVLLIGQAADNDTLLYDLSNAMYFRQLGLLDSTRVKLEQIADASDKALADVALFRLAELDLEVVDSSLAGEHLERLITGFPESYYCPLGLKIRADMLVKTEEGQDEARRIYRRLLEDFSDYPFVSEVREILRRLDTDAGIG